MRLRPNYYRARLSAGSFKEITPTAHVTTTGKWTAYCSRVIRQASSDSSSQCFVRRTNLHAKLFQLMYVLECHLMNGIYYDMFEWYSWLLIRDAVVAVVVVVAVSSSLYLVATLAGSKLVL